jgi:CheY-like chemotaxis protein
MPHKLLLADDSVTIQRVIELTFADEDVRVTAVGTGQQAIDAVTADPPDIVLADVGMPDRDGYEVAAFIKGRPALAHIPVLLLTGAFEPVDEARAAEARCDGVLAKPFEPHMLISRVKALLPKPGAPAWSPQEAPLQEFTSGAPGFAAAPAAPVAEDETALDMHALLDSQPGRSPDADVSLDDYFDRLDQAFANLAGSAGKVGSPVPTTWTPPAAVPREAPAPADPPAAPVAPPAQGLRPVAVADVFASILEAEAAGPAAAGAPLSVLVPPPAVSADLVERIVALVIDRLAEREVRQAVADTVSRVAERLVREEIERLKALPR